MYRGAVLHNAGGVPLAGRKLGHAKSTTGSPCFFCPTSRHFHSGPSKGPALCAVCSNMLRFAQVKLKMICLICSWRTFRSPGGFGTPHDTSKIEAMKIDTSWSQSWFALVNDQGSLFARPPHLGQTSVVVRLVPARSWSRVRRPSASF